MSTHPWIVLKFGGNSVANLQCWQTIAEITQQHLAKNLRPLIVCSALAGITNKLTLLVEAAAKGKHEKILQEIIYDYATLADDLSVATEPLLKNEIAELTRLSAELALTQTITPALHAHILAHGEIILTKLGAAYLQAQHFSTSWYDARTLLKSISIPHEQPAARYLAANCDYHKDQTVIAQLNQITSSAVLTQGFIASNAQNETVLLGRGGSDTSAAYLAAKLAATRCEIWTDVPGIYTANPREIPAARLLKSLDYSEAQEIASMGAKVLHPHSVPPLKTNNIPLYVGYTLKPQRHGTEITANGRFQDVPIKAISIKQPVTLIQIETVQMWQQVGFLADIFQYFKKYGLSVDLVSTSETTVTVSLDLKINNCGQPIVTTLLAELNTFCKAIEIPSCAMLSIVGHNIRAVLHKIGPALKVFEEEKVYLISQAANNLNLSFVVDENHVLALARKLHVLLIEENLNSQVFDQSWHEEFS